MNIQTIDPEFAPTAAGGWSLRAAMATVVNGKAPDGSQERVRGDSVHPRC